ncbi:MAG: peptidoglycan bridge formation glycyltransferase FemA/FemB family protein [Candidatus Levyibacteriota bacterium]|nr:MAG: peptidoglycan bridge formation glycyltransferase FemA/FemB family protein [Candidatus Levybacteria bacterium]
MRTVSLHPLQSKEWGEFRKKTGVKVVQKNGLQITIHRIPHTPWTIGYLPKGPLPDKEMVDELTKIGKEEHCIFIQLEPNVPANTSDGGSPEPIEGHDSSEVKLKNLGLRPSFHPLFTKYTFILDLTKNEDELLKNMHPKTRYNIKIAQKHGVEIVEDNSDEAFEEYLKLTHETTQRQGFYTHTENYHRLMWHTLHPDIAHLFLAKYKNEALAAWIIFVYGDTLYYPYGASSSTHRETMASNLLMWEVIKYGKKMGLKKFDMWGALGPNPDPKDPWFGFHKFKQGYGPQHVEFIGSFDLVINLMLYQLYKLADKLRWIYLKIKRLT